MASGTIDRERERVREIRDDLSGWRRWGPYVSDRSWGTVREDYSHDGNAWAYLTYDKARAKAYRWGEDGIAGLCDRYQLLCFAPAFWNEHDPHLKERLFGVNPYEGNHGEDVKEYYFHVDNTPSHSYMCLLYKYPQTAFPYRELIEHNQRRAGQGPEYELLDTGVFEGDRFFDIFIEYAKADPEDLAIRITAHNRGRDDAPLHILPTLWFRNTWAWGRDERMPALKLLHRPEVDEQTHVAVQADHATLGRYVVSADGVVGPDGVRPAVMRGDPDRQVLRIGLGVLDEDVEVAIALEHPGIEQLVLRTLSGATLVVLDQLAVRKRRLRILVEQAHIRVARRVVDVEVVFLHVLAVIALVRVDPEQPLLQVRIALVPERRREAQELVAVAQPGDAVLAPAVCLRARLVVGQIAPGVAIVRIVLAHGAPRSIRDVGAPAAPSG